MRPELCIEPNEMKEKRHRTYRVSTNAPSTQPSRHSKLSSFITCAWPSTPLATASHTAYHFIVQSTCLVGARITVQCRISKKDWLLTFRLTLNWHICVDWCHSVPIHITHSTQWHGTSAICIHGEYKKQEKPFQMQVQQFCSVWNASFSDIKHWNQCSEKKKNPPIMLYRRWCWDLKPVLIQYNLLFHSHLTKVACVLPQSCPCCRWWQCWQCLNVLHTTINTFAEV